jgi:hypothetical protein
MNISLTISTNTLWSTWSWHVGRYEPEAEVVDEDEALLVSDAVPGHDDLDVIVDQPAVHVGFRTTPTISRTVNRTPFHGHRL